MPLTLPRAFDSVGLRVGADLRNLIITLAWRSISEGLTDTELLLEVFLGLLSYQFSPL
jgi:hypothetical protein